MPALTVLIPAHNAGKTVASAVISVLRALPDDADILVLDDASTDDTAKIVSELGRCDRRVRMIASDRPSGVSGACNTLLAASEAPLVARMDADDIALRWRFSSQLRVLRRHHLDAVFTPAVMFGPTRTALRPQPPVPAGPEALPLELLLTCTLIHPTMLGRRAAIEAAGGYRTVAVEDWDLFMRMVLGGSRLARISTPGLLYRRHAGQITATAQWSRAMSDDATTAGVHEQLCKQMLGGASGAYRALVGPHADRPEVVAATDLIDEVWRRASDFAAPDRLGVRTNALAMKRQVRQWYSASRAAPPMD